MAATKEQDVVEAKGRAAALKEAYLIAILRYINLTDSDASNDSDLREALLELQKQATTYFNFYEEFVGNSSLLGAHENSLWAQGFAEDCLAVLQVMPDHFALIRKGFKALNIAVESNPSSTAYANMQRVCKRHLQKKLISQIKMQFSNSDLPIHGFQFKEGFTLSPSVRTVLAFLFGVVFIIVTLCVAIWMPNPSGFQYLVFRLVAALAAGGVVAVMPGFIELKLGLWLRAGGTLAVFAIVYFMNPAEQFTNSAPATSPIEQALHEKSQKIQPAGI
ncbi:hypothetical protein [Pseudomonas fluorescens]|uniref:Uncharacterized protein n=1 Tax=Pseudomonas fluorescens TaxID=294 RepID=A0A109KQE2_PSEFL|nr:hypothetical protein [Pseudomonas fluorescens]KWV73395.1 hypothetical protein PFL603g_03505 [Pseudomonas fluorescens]